MANLSLTLAMEDYDHVRDLMSGEISPKGIDLTCLNFHISLLFLSISLI